jgi:hypothetical protein
VDADTTLSTLSRPRSWMIVCRRVNPMVDGRGVRWSGEEGGRC